jgi:hypothetical protein
LIVARRSPKRYVQATIDLAIELYLANETMLKIGAKTGADAKTVRRWVRDAGHDLRRPGRPCTFDGGRILVERLRSGSSGAARAIGCHRSTVLRVARTDRAERG